MTAGLNRNLEWIALTLAVLTLGLLGGYVRYLEHGNIEASERARLQGQARTMIENLQQQLQAISTVLADIRDEFSRPDGIRVVTGASRRLKFLNDAMPGVRTIFLLDAQGKVLTADRDEMLGRDLSDRNYFKAARASPNLATLYVSAPYTTLKGVYSIDLTRAVLGPGGQFVGLVTASLDPEYFKVVMRSVLYAPDAISWLVHGDGVVFLNQPEVAGVAGVDLSRLGGMFSRYIESGQSAGVVSGIVRVTGAQQMMAAQTLQPAELQMDKPLIVAIGRDLSAIYQPWLRQTQLYAMLFLLLAAASCAALAWLHRRRITLGVLSALQESGRLSRELQRTALLSDRLQTSEAGLRESEQRLALVADAADLGIWIRDIERDEAWASDSWRTLFGYGPSERITLAGLLQRVHPEDRPSVSQALADAQKTAGSYETEFRVELLDGRLRWIAARGRAECDESGKPIVMRGVALDITTRKHGELELQLERRRAAHLARVSMLGALSGSLAHELNQPLTAILSNAQAAQRFLARENVDLDQLREILQDIVDEDKRAGEVIRRLRVLLGKGQTQRQSVDVNKLLQDVFRLLRNDLMNQRIRLQTELAPDLPVVNADLVQLQQVVINLMMNACNAISPLAAPEDRLIVVRSALAEGNSVRVSVIDRGPGIAADTLERAFEPFYTTKPQGMGLGLSICMTIVKAHGGQLWCENNAEGGASFHFSVPLQATDAT